MYQGLTFQTTGDCLKVISIDDFTNLIYYRRTRYLLYKRLQWSHRQFQLCPSRASTTACLPIRGKRLVILQNLEPNSSFLATFQQIIPTMDSLQPLHTHHANARQASFNRTHVRINSLNNRYDVHDENVFSSISLSPTAGSSFSENSPNANLRRSTSSLSLASNSLQGPGSLTSSFSKRWKNFRQSLLLNSKLDEHRRVSHSVSTISLSLREKDQFSDLSTLRRRTYRFVLEFAEEQRCSTEPPEIPRLPREGRTNIGIGIFNHIDEGDNFEKGYEGYHDDNNDDDRLSLSAIVADKTGASTPSTFSSTNEKGSMIGESLSFALVSAKAKDSRLQWCYAGQALNEWAEVVAEYERFVSMRRTGDKVESDEDIGVVELTFNLTGRAC